MEYLVNQNLSYDGLVSAVKYYYGGADSPDWQAINSAEMTTDSLIDNLNALPNVHAVKNYDGSVRLISQTYSTGSVSKNSNLAQQINSNAQVGTKTKTMTFDAPAKTTYQNGAFKATKMGTASTTQFITKEVVPAIAAAGVGISLGKTIDRALYNANPQMWNSLGLSSLNPDTWASITQDMNGSLGEMALGTAFNLLFGINPNNNNAQAYVDQTAYAYLTKYMYDNGFLTGVTSSLLNDTSILNYGDKWRQPIIHGHSSTLNISISDGTSDPSTTIFWVEFSGNGTPVLCRGDIGYTKLAYFNTSPFTITKKTILGDGTIYQTNTYNSTAFTYNNVTYYYVAFVGFNIPNEYNPNLTGETNYFNSGGYDFQWTQTYCEDVCKILYLGTTTTNQYEGVANQPSATLPDLHDGMSIADILTALQSQYPTMFNNAVTVDTAQPDGTTKQYTYLPIPYPNASGVNDTQPTGGTGTQTQQNTSYNPANATIEDVDFFWNLIDPTKPTFPDYGDGNGGDGSTPTPVMPTGSASALWKIYNPSQSQLDDFGAWLWSSDFVDQLLKLFNDPMQAIIGLHKIFVTPPTSGSGAIKVGYLTSTASANYVSGQYVDLDCGSVTVYEIFGNVFDYDPFTRISLYLPFIGIVPLNNTDIMRGKINVKYHVDVLTGACLAEVIVTRDGVGGTLYTFSGNCAVQYPVSSGSYVGIITGLIGIAGGIAGTIASGGALAPALMGAGASVGAMHTNISHSGDISANAGAMGIKKPYLIIERPQPKLPDNGVKIEGKPENKTVTLSSIKGFARVKKCHYDGINCTANELDRIKALLENGVFIN